MPRRWVWLGCGFVVVLCAGVAYYLLGFPPFGGTGHSQQAAAKPLQVKATQVREASLPVESSYTGVVISPRDTEIKARVSGYVMSRPFLPGSMVKANDVLFTIDPRPYEVQLAQDVGKRKQAQSLITYYSDEVARYKPLERRGYATQERLELARKNLGQAEGQLSVAEAQIAQQELNLAYATVRAPYSGRTGVTDVNVGDLVSADQTNLVRLTQVNPILIQVALSESDVRAVQAVLKRNAPATLEIVHRDGTRERHEARIVMVDNQFNSSTARLRVRAVIDNADDSLIPGAFLNVRLELGHEQKLVVPTRALTAQLDQHLVYLLNDGKAHVRQVQTGRQYHDDTVINKGVKAGDVIAINHLQNLNDGTAVTIEASSGAAADNSPQEQADSGSND
ncbi:MAG: efflux RND transporter periplasmic adaptor subunit [Proteobacteria bacterium]|nr:efflux RND transporter periplasmic adaptor subunit [Pseudomonadota bacterium]